MFDFLKKKSYDIEFVNGTKKLVIAKNVNSTLEGLSERFQKILDVLKTKLNVDTPKFKKEKDAYVKDLEESIKEINDFLEAYEKVNNLKDISKYKDLSKKLDKYFKNLLKVGIDIDFDEQSGTNTDNSDNADTTEVTVTETAKTEQPKEESATKDTEKETSEETNKGEEGFDINSILEDVSTDNSNEQSKEESLDKEIKQSVNSKDIKVTADKAPGSSKYRAEGIKERLLEINKEVVNVKTPGVTYVGGVDKSVITPGPKSTSVKVKEEVVRPDIVVQNVKIRIMRDEGEKGKLLPEKNIKMPKGDVVVKKAATDNQKVKQLSEDKRAEYYAKKEKAKLENKSAEELDMIDKEFGVSASLYDQAMIKIFAEFNNKTEFDGVEEDINEEESQKLNNDNDLESLIERL